MSDLTLRNVKGTPLTNQEVDDNFSNLNADKYQAGDSPTFADITADSLQITGGTGTQGTISWNVEDETLDLIVSDDVTYQLGQELGFVARNLSGQTLANGRVVRATGASGNKLTINIADATTELGSAPTVGVVTETISNNSTGRVTTAGFVRGLNTSAIAEGSPIYLGTNGTFTATQPTSPSHLVHIGWVIRSHATEGSILVHVNNGWELEELHNVLITSVADNEVLQWNAASSVWENRTLAEANIAELGTNVSFQDVTVGGDLTVSGTLTTINAQDLAIADNMIYLNDGSTNTNPDLGFAANYNDGSYKHAGLFRDADDGRWKFYDSYTLEPDAAIYIDTSHASFAYAPIQASVVYASSSNSDNWTTAYGWGNHATAGYQPANTALTTSTNFGGDVSGVYNNIVVSDNSHNHLWANITDKPTTFPPSTHNHDSDYVNVTGDSMSGDLVINKAVAAIKMGYNGGPHGIQFYDDDSTLKWGFYYRTSPDTITFELNGSSAKFTLDTSGNLTLAGTLSASGYNKTNWDAAYTYSQVDHLPRSGGTLTGNVTINNSTSLYFDDAGTGTPSRLWRAGGNATRFEYYDNVFIFDAKDNANFEIRNSADVIKFSHSPSDGNTRTYGRFLANNGTAASPAFSFNDDGNTGIYSDGNDGLYFSTAGGAKAYVNSSGLNSLSNVYIANGGSFRNYAGVWAASTGLTGNGFTFVNSIDGTAMTITSTGTVQAIADFRAPIFYDSNNTAFYANPAATSKFTTLHLGASGQILTSSAALQVNGFMRTGNIIVHDGGNTPNTATQTTISATGGELYRAPSTGGGPYKIYDEGNFNPSDYLTTAAYVDDYVNAASFNTGTGVLTLTRAEGGTVTVDLDGRYLTSETDSQTLSWNGNTGQLSISNGNTVDLDGRYLPVTGGTLDNGTSTSLTILCDDGGEATLSLRGDSQGTGRLFVGQSNTHGGGIEYNGDSVPTTTGAGSDYITLWRRTAGVDYWTARNLHNSNNWEFRGNLYVNTTQRVFADDYHPNADTWTTARTNTVTLTGDVTGTGSASVNGSGNWTVSISTTVGNDSHSHSNYVLKAGDTMTGALTAPSFNLTAGTQLGGYSASYTQHKSNATTVGGLRFVDSADALKGYIYWESAGHIGLLRGGSWAVKADASNYIGLFGSTRSPIYYDMDNTAYYVNPASSSYLYGLTTQTSLYVNGDNNRVRVGGGGGGKTVTIGNTATNDGTNLDYAGYIAYDCYFDGTNWAADRTSIGRKWMTQVGGYHNNSWSINYYGGDVTSPWADSAWTRLFTITEDGTTTIGGVTQAQRDVKVNGQLRATGWWNSSAGTNYDGLAAEIGISSGRAWLISYDRNTSSYGALSLGGTEVRLTATGYAPIIYDSNDTAYYANPASTSNFNTLNVGTINRNPTVTLSGDVTGSATMTNLGSINIATTVANDSHTHDNRYVRVSDGTGGDLDTEYDAQMFAWSPSTNGTKPSSSYGQGISIVSSGSAHNDTNNWITQLAFGTDENSAEFRSKTNAGNWNSWKKLFHDGYHPNADKWTTARTFTVSLTGDVTGSVSQSVDGSANKTWSIATTVAAPAAPAISATNIVGENIEIVFGQSATSGVDAYEVYSSVNGGSYGLIARITPESFATTMTVVDAVFSVTGVTVAYRVYAVKNGSYSSPATSLKTYTTPSLDVTNMSVVPTNTAYQIQYELPDSRFIDHIEIYMDAEAVQANLSRTGATLIYSGTNSGYLYPIGATDLDKYHQFWVEVVSA